VRHVIVTITTTITSTNINTVCLTPPTTGPKTTLGMAAHAKKALKDAVRPKRERTPIVSDLLAESADAKAMAKLLGRSQVSGSKTIFSISVRLVRLGQIPAVISSRDDTINQRHDTSCLLIGLTTTDIPNFLTDDFSAVAFYFSGF
jgi:hypothetical protein